MCAEDDDADFYDAVIGATIVAVHDDAESVWLHLSDGSMIKYFALPEGGFDVEIYPPET